MPIPTPRKNESEEDFLERCHGNDTMNEEYPPAQKSAICYKQWRQRNKEE